ncbi:MAG TPA: TetR/AcrR family transcriptional regulator [Solirubrobacteraceae bacterium]|jgi:AcrR family transcriptional regulator|nr:TetR/AcrR family transcriptional regulator [Solirubrobacteraceae bacterium]
MAYRRTERTEARLAQTRERVLRSAHELIATGGYRAAGVAAVAARADVATGTVYRHFPGKAELFAEVFRRASQREVDAVTQASTGEGPVQERMAAAVETFARRALRGRRLAWALIAEPVDPLVEAERLCFRRAYRDAFSTLLEDGVRRGELPAHHLELTAAAIVGALAEALVGPLAPAAPDADPDVLIADLVAFCLRALPARKDLSDGHQLPA